MSYLPTRGRTLNIPAYFPSISSVKTGLSPFAYFKVLKALQQSHFLVSAFDIHFSSDRTRFVESLQQCRSDDGPIIMMDSGNYESYWLSSNEWDIDKFHAVLEQEVCDLAFCFDNQFPPADIEANIEYVIETTGLSQSRTKESTVIPILHGSEESLIEIVLSFQRRTQSTFLSIPERILGAGLLERVRTITKLRKRLNEECENYTYIHLLGTGNPFSLMLLSFAGADTFDGLEWCQTAANSKTALLYHFQQRDLIKDQCNFCNEPEFDYVLGTLGHNLTFYRNWMELIQQSIEDGTEQELLTRYFDSDIVSTLGRIWLHL